MGVVKSDFIVQYLTACASEGRFYVAMELVRGVEFRDAIVARQTSDCGDFTFEQVKRWTTQLAQGLEHLHNDCHLVHQDLHNGNVMLDGLTKDADGSIDMDNVLLQRTKVKILDLGLSSFKTEHTMRGTVRLDWNTGRMQGQDAETRRRKSFVVVAAEEVGGFKAIRAPEMQTGSSNVRFSSKADMWALGILLCEATLVTPIEEWYDERAVMQSFGRTPELQRAKLDEVTERSPCLGDLLCKLLVADPAKRLSATELLKELHNLEGGV